MIHNGFLVHPDIWMLWVSIFLSVLDTAILAIIAFVWLPYLQSLKKTT